MREISTERFTAKITYGHIRAFRIVFIFGKCIFPLIICKRSFLSGLTKNYISFSVRKYEFIENNLFYNMLYFPSHQKI